MTSPLSLPQAFPDLFTFTLRDLLAAELTAPEADFPVQEVLVRPVRPTDANRTIGIVPGEAEPAGSEIRGNIEPTLIEWPVVVQVFVKHADEIEGRNVRSRLIQRVRRTLFLPGTVQALMTLNDGYERVSKFNIRRFDPDSATARDANKQFFFLGQVELFFQTEKL